MWIIIEYISGKYAPMLDFGTLTEGDNYPLKWFGSEIKAQEFVVATGIENYIICEATNRKLHFN